MELVIRKQRFVRPQVIQAPQIGRDNADHYIRRLDCRRREEIEHVAHLATYEEIKAQDFNLSVSTYVEQEDTREKIDIKVLNEDISKIVEKENKLRAEIDKIIAEIEG